MSQNNDSSFTTSEYSGATFRNETSFAVRESQPPATPSSSALDPRSVLETIHPCNLSQIVADNSALSQPDATADLTETLKVFDGREWNTIRIADGKTNEGKGESKGNINQARDIQRPGFREPD